MEYGYNVINLNDNIKENTVHHVEIISEYPVRNLKEFDTV